MLMEKSKTSETILLIIWIQALVATLGSLFYSEVMGFVPCELCWIQRIFMYPLVMIYGVAAFKKDLSIALPGLFLSGIGMFISAYHYLLQRSEEHTSELQSRGHLVCRLLLEKKI